MYTAIVPRKSPPTGKRTMFSFYLDPDLRKGLEEIRDRDGVPTAETVRRAIRAWLKLRKVALVLGGRKKGG
jgi:hypothetical protein